MLDFYFSSPDADADQDPDEAQYIGSLDLEQHRSLQAVLDACKRSGIHLPYHDDARLSPSSASTFLTQLQANQHLAGSPAARTALQALLSIVSQAANRQLGFHTFCD